MCGSFRRGGGVDGSGGGGVVEVVVGVVMLMIVVKVLRVLCWEANPTVCEWEGITFVSF